MTSLCTIQFNTHSVSVNLDENGTYHVFKYDSKQCQLESFADREDAEEYILYPFPSVQYSLIINEDE